MVRPRTRLQSVLDHAAVTAPQQERSQRTLQRILTALGELLNEKSFEQISMVELAERAGCAVTSIYARFKDKWSMIAALHESFRDDAIVRIDSFLAPERWRGATSEEIIAAAMATLVATYHEHRHLMRAVLLTDDPLVYRRAASIRHHAADRLAQVLPALTGSAANSFRRRVEFGMRLVVATLEQKVLFDSALEARAIRTNAELSRELTALLISYLGCAQEKSGCTNRTHHAHRRKR